MLVILTNSVVRDQSGTGWRRIGSFFTRLYVAKLRDVDVSDDSIDDLSEAATELFSLQLAVENIQARHFAGECILATDVGDSLKLPTMVLQGFLEGLDQELKRAGHPELVVDSAEFRNVVKDKASKKERYVRALAKSEMLEFSAVLTLLRLS